MKPTIGLFSFLLIVLPLLLCVQCASAHTPLRPPDNSTLETAFEVHNPAKSWAIYAVLPNDGGVQYYRFEMGQDARLRLMLFVPTVKEDFLPNLAILGPGIASQDAVPENVKVPDGVGVMVVEPQRPTEPSYEPFTPSSYFYLADVDLRIAASGTYYLAVFESSRGHYGVAIGYLEEFGLDEWIRIPIDVISIHLWEEQSLCFILAPMLATIFAGFVILAWRRPSIFRRIFSLTGVTAGLIYLGSGMMMLAQMILALTAASADMMATITVVFMLIPFLLGMAILRLTIDPKEVNIRTRAYVAIFGLLGMFAWAGTLIGPALALLTSILPASYSQLPKKE